MTNANLFDPFDLHGLKLPNRILMSAMTRTRATEDDAFAEAGARGSAPARARAHEPTTDRPEPGDAVAGW